MKIKLSQSEVCLPKRQTLTLANAAGVRIVARSGVVWVTQDRDSRDTVLNPGESVAFETPDRVIVQALAPALVGLSQVRRHRARAARGWWHAVTSAVRRLRLPQLAWA
jgi:hypothetical protein